MINKDFLKRVLREEKHLMPLTDVKYVNVPRYDELSVRKFWPIFQSDESFMKFMPEKDYKSILPDREYFWNIANTV